MEPLTISLLAEVALVVMVFLVVVALPVVAVQAESLMALAQSLQQLTLLLLAVEQVMWLMVIRGMVTTLQRLVLLP
jgi:hypothetical protein